jgi:hypothetical protein
MGQRHQIFIHVPNPVHCAYEASITDKMKQYFGTEPTTILPFHNQWLYGRTALLSCLNVLRHSFAIDHKDKIGKNGFGSYISPFSHNGIRSMFTDPDKFVAAIEFIMNYIPDKWVSNDAGFLGSFYLGVDEPEMRDDFTMGDNNDGITIIDVINNKYCFMNISKYKGDEGERCYSAADLPYLVPVSAHDYVRAYYGESLKTCSPYFIREERQVAQNKTAKQLVKEIKNDNMKLVRQFANFEVLNSAEVAKLFPKLEKQISEKSLVVSE